MFGKRTIFLLFGLTILFYGCATEPSMGIKTATSPKTEPTIPASTATQRQAVMTVETEQPTEIPSRTIEPTITQTPIPYPTLIGPLPTEIDYQAGCGTGCFWGNEIMDDWGLSCPDGYKKSYLTSEQYLPAGIEWLAYTCLVEDYFDRLQSGLPGGELDWCYTSITNREKTRTWNIDYDRLDWAKKTGLCLYPYRWTDDGRGVYLTPHVYQEVDGPLPADLYKFDIALYYLDLSNGRLSELLPVVERDPANDSWDASTYSGSVFLSYTFWLSPDGKKFAFTLENRDNELEIRTVNNKTLDVVTLRPDQAGVYGLFWNRESDEVIFSTLPPYSEDDTGQTTICKYSLTSGKLTTILESNPNNFITAGYHWTGEDADFWYDKSNIWIEPLSWESDLARQHIIMNIHTGEISIISTPNP